MWEPNLVSFSLHFFGVQFNTSFNICFVLYICLAYRIKENGQERVEIEEDGVLKSVLINGKTSQTLVQRRKLRTTANLLLFVLVFDISLFSLN